MEVEFDSLDWLEDEGDAEQTSATAVSVDPRRPSSAPLLGLSRGRDAPTHAASAHWCPFPAPTRSFPAAGSQEVWHEARQHCAAHRCSRKHACQERVRRGEAPTAALERGVHESARLLGGAAASFGRRAWWRGQFRGQLAHSPQIDLFSASTRTMPRLTAPAAPLRHNGPAGGGDHQEQDHDRRPSSRWRGACWNCEP